MYVYIDRDELARGLERANVATSKASDLEESVHLAASDGGIALSARGPTLSAATSVVCNTVTAGTARVHGQRLLTAVRSLQHPTVELATTPKGLRLRSARTTLEFDTLPDDEPDPIVVAAPVTLELDALNLRRMLDATAFAITTDDVRYGLNGLHLEVVEHDGATWLRASATDGHRLALAGASIREGRLAMPPRTLLSRKTVAAMRTILRGAERHERATLSFTEGEVSPSGSAFGAIDACGTRLAFALEHGEFPDYRSVFPASWSTRIDVRRRDLLDMLKRAAAVLPEEGRLGRILALTVVDDGFVARTSWSGIGRFEEFVPAEVDGAPITIGFSRNYLLNAADAMQGERFVLETAGALSPCRIEDPDGNGHDLQIVMPMRYDEDDLRAVGVPSGR